MAKVSIRKFEPIPVPPAVVSIDLSMTEAEGLLALLRVGTGSGTLEDLHLTALTEELRSEMRAEASTHKFASTARLKR